MTESAEDEKVCFTELLGLMEKETGAKPDAFEQVGLHSVAFAISQLVRKRAFDEAEWKGVYVGPYLKPFAGLRAAEGLAVELRKRWMEIDKVCLFFF